VGRQPIASLTLAEGFILPKKEGSLLLFDHFFKSILFYNLFGE